MGLRVWRVHDGVRRARARAPGRAGAAAGQLPAEEAAGRLILSKFFQITLCARRDASHRRRHIPGPDRPEAPPARRPQHRRGPRRRTCLFGTAQPPRLYRRRRGAGGEGRGRGRFCGGIFWPHRAPSRVRTGRGRMEAPPASRLDGPHRGLGRTGDPFRCAGRHKFGQDPNY